MSDVRKGVLPNFLFIGPDKAGSTWLYDVLSRHPQVYLPHAKDTYYFGSEFYRGTDWYARFFANAPHHVKIIGEICHDYLYHAEAPQRIREILPEARLMVCIRDPVDRAYSSYLNLLRHGWKIGTFGEALNTVDHLLDHGRYAKYLKRYYQLFDASQMIVTWFDDLRASPQRYLDSVTDALSLRSYRLSNVEAAPVRPAAAPRSAFVARQVKRAAEVARDVGMANLVGRVKSTPVIRHLIWRDFTNDTRPAPDAGEIAVARQRLHDDVDELERLLQIDVRSRWGW